MLDRYHSESSSPSSYYDSWAHSTTFLYPSKYCNDDQIVAEFPPSTTLPRAKFITPKHHSTSRMFHVNNQQSQSIKQFSQRATRKHDDDFRYNIPLQERF